MSHLTVMSQQIREADLAYLKKAVNNFASQGLKWREGQTTHRWYGENVGDYTAEDAATRQGFDTSGFGKCLHAIGTDDPRMYEIGVVRQSDGNYALLYDFWNGGYGLSKIVGAKGERLLQEFAKEKALALARKHGFSVDKISVENGMPQLTLTRSPFGGKPAGAF